MRGLFLIQRVDQTRNRVLLQRGFQAQLTQTRARVKLRGKVEFRAVLG